MDTPRSRLVVLLTASIIVLVFVLECVVRTINGSSPKKPLTKNPALSKAERSLLSNSDYDSLSRPASGFLLLKSIPFFDPMIIPADFQPQVSITTESEEE